ncbi:mannose-binding protein [Streptomyces clavifer]|uniref:mannose-binding protein n=1 Tax=Streptomyces clavifer TaxID=68188 RepID=UPI00331F1D99
MSPQQPTPGANAAAAAPDAPEAGPPAPGTAPPEKAPAPAAAPDAKAGSDPAGETAVTPAAESGTTPATGTTAAPGAKSGTAPAGETAVTPPQPPAPTGAAEAPEEGIGVAAAVGTAPDTRTATGLDRGRPRTPVLAGAAIAGAALIAIPLLLIGSANDDGRDNSAKGPVAGGADTVLHPNSAPVAADDYVVAKPSPSPSKEKPKKVEAPKAVVPAPVVPAPEPKPSATAEKKKPKSTPKPKPAPKPDWTTVTFSAPSVLGVNQAWTTNRIRLVMQTDGNLVLLNEHGKPIWASMTFGQNHRAIFQHDGNLVIHNGDDRPIWASKTHDFPGAQLILRADAKVVIVHNGNVVWST